MYGRGGGFARFGRKLENLGFQVLGKSDNLATPPRVRRGTFQIAVSRARSINKIPAGPDGSGAPPEPSGAAGILFMDRACEGGSLLTHRGSFVVAGILPKFPGNAKSCKPQFSPKSHKVLLPLYIGAAPLQMPPEPGAREKAFRSDPDASEGASEASGSDRNAFLERRAAGASEEARRSWRNSAKKSEKVGSPRTPKSRNPGKSEPAGPYLGPGEHRVGCLGG